MGAARESRSMYCALVFRWVLRNLVGGMAAASLSGLVSAHAVYKLVDQRAALSALSARLISRHDPSALFFDFPITLPNCRKAPAASNG